MPEIWMDVDVNVTVPVNLLPLIALSDFKTVLASETYDEPGLELIWNFITTNGVQTYIAVTPTNTGGNYDWTNIGHGMYNIEIPASGGSSANNDTEGFGWFTGIATDALPWRSPVIGFRKSAINDMLIDGGTLINNLEDFFDGTGYAGGTTKLVVDLADDVITSSKFDESTAFPLKSADAGSTTIARTGVDGDTLETISDQLDSVPTSILDHEISGHLTAGTIGNLIASLGGKMSVTSNQLIVYSSDNATELFRFNLLDSAGSPTMTNVYTRTVALP